MNPRLAMRRANAEPKCANCAFWSHRDADASAASGTCERDNTPARDLDVCSRWLEHVVHTGRVLRPDEIIDER